MTDRSACLEELRGWIARLEVSRRRDNAFITSGCPPLDAALPEKGFRRGSLVEWLAEGEGTAAGTLALLAARAACGGEGDSPIFADTKIGTVPENGTVPFGGRQRGQAPFVQSTLRAASRQTEPVPLDAQQGGLLVVMDRHRDFCPPAAVRLGISIEQLVVVHPENAADHDWAMDQVLRWPAVAAVLAWPEKLNPKTFRRWQLAAEEAGTLGLLLRPASARGDPSWADVRILVECAVGGDSSRRRLPSRIPLRSATAVASYRPLRLVLLRCRGAADGRIIDVELDDETYRVHPARLQIEGCRLQIAN